MVASDDRQGRVWPDPQEGAMQGGRQLPFYCQACVQPLVRHWGKVVGQIGRGPAGAQGQTRRQAWGIRWACGSQPTAGAPTPYTEQAAGCPAPPPSNPAHLPAVPCSHASARIMAPYHCCIRYFTKRRAAAPEAEAAPGMGAGRWQPLWSRRRASAAATLAGRCNVLCNSNSKHLIIEGLRWRYGPPAPLSPP